MIPGPELYDALASDNLIRLENRNSEWAIVFRSHDGQSIREISDATFDTLMWKWLDILHEIEMAKA